MFENFETISLNNADNSFILINNLNIFQRYFLYYFKPSLHSLAIYVRGQIVIQCSQSILSVFSQQIISVFLTFRLETSTINWAWLVSNPPLYSMHHSHTTISLVQQVMALHQGPANTEILWSNKGGKKR